MVDVVLGALHAVIDPELGIDVVSLGLVRDVRVTGARVEVDLTMTTPACPLGEVILSDAEEAIRAVEGVEEVEVRLVWDPPWTPDDVSDAVRDRLGLPARRSVIESVARWLGIGGRDGG